MRKSNLSVAMKDAPAGVRDDGDYLTSLASRNPPRSNAPVDSEGQCLLATSSGVR